MESFKEKETAYGRARADEISGGKEEGRGERWERGRKKEKSTAISVKLLNKFL